MKPTILSSLFLLLLNISCTSTPTATPMTAPSLVAIKTAAATQPALPVLTVTETATVTNTPLPTLTQTSTPTPTLTPIRAAVPTAIATPTIIPTTIPTSTQTRTEIPSGTPTHTTIAQTPNPDQGTATVDQSNNPPASCGNIPGTVQIGIGFFNIRARTVTFCNADLAAMDACEPHNLEYCHCNSTSGCCENPGRDLAVGEQTTTLHYPAGTTSFQASIPPACRTHKSDRVLIIGFASPLP